MAWYTAAGQGTWGKRVLATLLASKVPATQTNFPLLVVREATEFTDAQANGEEFVVTESDGATELPLERITYDQGLGRIVMWFRASVVSAIVDNNFYIYYSNAIAPDKEQAASVWTNGFVAVVHMHEPNTDPQPQWKDSTGNGYHMENDVGSPVSATATYQDGVECDPGQVIGQSTTNAMNGANSYCWEVWYTVDAAGQTDGKSHSGSHAEVRLSETGDALFYRLSGGYEFNPGGPMQQNNGDVLYDVFQWNLPSTSGEHWHGRNGMWQRDTGAARTAAASDGATTASTGTFTSASSDFVTDGVVAGDTLTITSGASAGDYSVVTRDSATLLTVSPNFTATETSLDFRVYAPTTPATPDDSAVNSGTINTSAQTHKLNGQFTTHGDYTFWEYRFSEVYRDSTWLELTHETSANYLTFWQWGSEELFADIPATATIKGVEIGSMVALIRIPRREVTRFNCPVHTAGSLNGRYVDHDTPWKKRRFWFSTLGSGTPPAAGGRELVNVDLSASNLTAAQVCAEFTPVCHALDDVNAVVGGQRESVGFTTLAAAGLLNTYYTLSAPDGSGGEVDFRVANAVDGNFTDPGGVTEITLFTCVDNTADQLHETYLTFTAKGSPDEPSYVWFDSGGGTDPAPVGFPTGYRVAITNGDTAIQVAEKMAAALKGASALFLILVTNETVALQNVNVGTVTDAADGTAATNFTITISQQGSNPAVAGLENTRLIRVDINGGDDAETVAIKHAEAIDAFDEFTAKQNPQDLDEVLVECVAGGSVTDLADGDMGITGISVTTQGTSDGVELTNEIGGQVPDAVPEAGSGFTVDVLEQGDNIHNELVRLASAAASTVELTYLVGEAFPMEIKIIRGPRAPIAIEREATQAGLTLEVGDLYRPDRSYSNPP